MCCAKAPSQRPSCSGRLLYARVSIRLVTPQTTTMTFRALDREDPEVADLIRKEFKRQSETLELIASENLTSPAILEALGTLLTNKYADGYPGRRHYSRTPGRRPTPPCTWPCASRGIGSWAWTCRLEATSPMAAPRISAASSTRSTRMGSTARRR